MYYPKLDDDTLDHTAQVYLDHGRNQTATATALGLTRSTTQHRLEKAAERGFLSGKGEALPPGQIIERVSRLIKDPDGNPIWLKSKTIVKPNAFDPEALRVTFADFEGLALNPPGPVISMEDLLEVYVIADLHLGMYAWKPEAGNNYTIDIADKLQTCVMMDLISRAPLAKTALILNLGDFFHSDNNQGKTERSGNILDTDTRYGRVQRAGVDLMLQMIHLALQKHERVIVRNIPGNHDPYSTQNLTIALQAYYHDHPRVTIENSVNPFYFHQHGAVMIGAAHGDMAKPNQIVNTMAAKAAEMWGLTKFRYVYMGHIHRKSRGHNMDMAGEFGGAQWETFQTIAPRDAWGNSMGFTAGRSMQAITLHKDRGEIDRLTSPIHGIV